MYGSKKYRRISKSVEQPVRNSVPTYICQKCKVVKFVSSPFSELSLVENKHLICYTKICETCTTLLKAWIKG